MVQSGCGFAADGCVSGSRCRCGAYGSPAWAPRGSERKDRRGVGQAGTLDIVVEAPGGQITSLTVALEKKAARFRAVTLEGSRGAAPTGVEGAAPSQTGRIQSAGRAAWQAQVPERQQGPRASRFRVATSFLISHAVEPAAKDFKSGSIHRLAVFQPKNRNHGGPSCRLSRAPRGHAGVASGVEGQ